MADQEIIEHTKEAFKILGSKNHSIWKKIKDFLVEISIIVFAISLSIWFHSISEHRHEQKEVKEFLLGLKEDLANDLKEMEVDKQSFVNNRKAIQYATSIKMNEVLSSDSIRKYVAFFDVTRLIINNSRFDGFKSSGKIGSIENNTLQIDVLSFYQDNVPSLLLTTDIYNQRKEKLFDYVFKNRKRITDTTTNLNVVLSSDEAQNRIRDFYLVTEIIRRYDVCIAKAKKIIEEIHHEYEE